MFILAISAVAQAQIESGSRNGRPTEEPLPQNIKETLAKQRIEEKKKDFEELLSKGKKAVEMSEQLQNSFAQNQRLTPEDVTKLKDLEKLLKKIRSDLGGDGDDEEEIFDKPTSTSNALETLNTTATDLFEEIKKTSRYTISAVAIKSSNTILNILKFLRISY